MRTISCVLRADLWVQVDGGLLAGGSSIRKLVEVLELSIRMRAAEERKESLRTLHFPLIALPLHCVGSVQPWYYTKLTTS